MHDVSYLIKMISSGTVFRIFTLTSLYRFIPRFGSLQEALLQRPAAVAADGPSITVTGAYAGR